MRLVFDLAVWDPLTAAQLCAVLTSHDARQIEAGRVPTLLFDSGVVYQTDPSDEPLFDAVDVLARGAGDCEDLAAFRAAELRTLGERALRPGDDLWAYPDVDFNSARVVLLDFGANQYHAVVAVDTDRGIVREDPSARLGMTARRIDPIIQQRWTIAGVQPRCLPRSSP